MKEMKEIKVKLEIQEAIIDDGSQCVCGKIEIEEHTCPFNEEICCDFHNLCSCCSYCTYQCALDI